MLRVAEHGISLEETRKLNAVVLVCADVCTLCAKKSVEMLCFSENGRRCKCSRSGSLVSKSSSVVSNLVSKSVYKAPFKVTFSKGL